MLYALYAFFFFYFLLGKMSKMSYRLLAFTYIAGLYIDFYTSIHVCNIQLVLYYK